MNKYDAINAFFEFGSAALLIMNIQRLYKDKKLSGVSVIPTAFFCLWGAWNLIYYKELGQTLSYITGVCVFLNNTVWVSLAVYYNAHKPVEQVEKPLETCCEVGRPVGVYSMTQFEEWVRSDERRLLQDKK